MRHKPFFRWVLALGLLLLTGSALAYSLAPDMPELRQVGLTVLSEKKDGTCSVRWTDPFDRTTRTGTYRCDPDRDPLLKPPYHDPETRTGYESGFVVAEGSGRGRLYNLGEDDAAIDRWIDVSDMLAVFGLLLITTGVIGGNVRAVGRMSGVSRGVLDRAWRLAGAAAAVEEDRARAVEAVRTAWEPLHRARVREELGTVPVTRLRDDERRRFRTKEWERAGITTVRDVLDAGEWRLGQLPGVGRRTAEKALAAARWTAEGVSADTLVRLAAGRSDPRADSLVTALRVLVEAGPEGRAAAEAATELAEAEGDGAGPRFGQTSVDLLRGPGGELDVLAAWTDFERRPEEYYAALAEATRDAHRLVA
ncbi:MULTISPECIES: helix-hairpin-helix domain-containing protein [unclassified Streptomyces]|uniref:helix-hairpin-helix domain-containing protein n=1 Tax=unclassified Streptomyces TaxID=2593676 RepID=UPI000DAEB0E3|nr:MULTISPECIES: helix-hairpin-helix domain-containing protein [unclassified Streptomyces]PZT77726.1 hypothetical protein DNK56_31780 [Streptomyces sp. AC1-42W]PZT78323.1 hypothetical protein DNK55_00910 [Streptomyces sp. AC1-42T]